MSYTGLTICKLALRMHLPDWLTRPLSVIRNPNDFVQRLLDLQLSAEDIGALSEAAARGTHGFGDYYRWHLQKQRVAALVRQPGRNRATLLDSVRKMDRTDYTDLTSLLPSGRGCILALPHHGHYIPTAIRLMEHLAETRRVHILYGDPTSHPGNEVFDDLGNRLFGGTDRPHRNLHADRAGMTSAMRALRAGAALIMMPDVHRYREQTWAIPFCGRPLEIMLGTAAMARRTNSLVLPIVSAIGTDLRAHTVWGPLLDPSSPMNDRFKPMPGVADYGTTLQMFEYFEEVMNPQLIYWQHVRMHLSTMGSFTSFPSGAIPAAWQAFLRDTRAQLPPDPAYDLD